PDGRLLQVEYARKTVRQGKTAVGIVAKDGVILAADKNIIDKLVIAEGIEKISQVDEHIAITSSGLTSDGRVLIEKCRATAQNHRITYGEPIDLLDLTKTISDHAQVYTQYGGARPYGVSLLISGVDDTGAHVFMTEPSGIFFEYQACAIGEGSAKATKILESKWKSGLTIDEGIRLGLDALKSSAGSGIDLDRIEVVCIDKKGFVRLSAEEIKKYAK
ncbi:MAG: archaeal proteasome endopeptidase complex subunit alpha, partial [Candidatus Omnitrophica bacterium]|nr:archaeal proteasome endopeptidase complex subunit alpha [Candidatus Omnitrophota bacterium]